MVFIFLSGLGILISVDMTDDNDNDVFIILQYFYLAYRNFKMISIKEIFRLLNSK